MEQHQIQAPRRSGGRGAPQIGHVLTMVFMVS
jgi:hypothetical protein